MQLLLMLYLLHVHTNQEWSSINQPSKIDLASYVRQLKFQRNLAEMDDCQGALMKIVSSVNWEDKEQLQEV